MSEQRGDDTGDALDVDTDADELGEPVDPDGEALAAGRLGGEIPGAGDGAPEEGAPEDGLADDDARVDEESRESFPASDAPAHWAGPEAPPPPR